MTSFYWVDTKQEAQSDAAYKGVSSWFWASSKNELISKDYKKFEAVYLKRGLIELEREFARIMRENRPKWLC